MSWYIRVSAVAAAGLADARIDVAHQSISASSFARSGVISRTISAAYSREPQRVSVAASSRANSSSVIPHG